MVENSSWIEELESLIAAHTYYHWGFWRQLKHFLPLHDSRFECVALSFKIGIRHLDPAKLLATICQRLERALQPNPLFQ